MSVVHYDVWNVAVWEAVRVVDVNYVVYLRPFRLIGDLPHGPNFVREFWFKNHTAVLSIRKDRQQH